MNKIKRFLFFRSNYIKSLDKVDVANMAPVTARLLLPCCSCLCIFNFLRVNVSTIVSIATKMHE